MGSWGTGQAVLAAKALIHEPFAVINADDYHVAKKRTAGYMTGWFWITRTMPLQLRSGISGQGFKKFFESDVKDNPLKAEHLLPTHIGGLLRDGKYTVKVLETFVQFPFSVKERFETYKGNVQAETIFHQE